MKLTDYIKMWDNYFVESINDKSYIPKDIVLREYYDSYKAKGKNTIKQEKYMPEPFLGDFKNASVAIINKNPGGVLPWQNWESGEVALKMRETSLTKDLEAPYSEWAKDFVYFKTNDGGGDFFRNRLKYMNYILEENYIADNLLNIELYPWHSSQFDNKKFDNDEFNFKEFVLDPLMDTNINFVFLLRKYVSDVAERCGLKFKLIDHTWNSSTLQVKISEYEGKVFIATENFIKGYPGNPEDKKYLKEIVSQYNIK